MHQHVCAHFVRSHSAQVVLTQDTTGWCTEGYREMHWAGIAGDNPHGLGEESVASSEVGVRRKLGGSILRALLSKRELAWPIREYDFELEHRQRLNELSVVAGL